MERPAGLQKAAPHFMTEIVKVQIRNLGSLGNGAESLAGISQFRGS
jgi:hypothetical protein